MRKINLIILIIGLSQLLGTALANASDLNEVANNLGMYAEAKMIGESKATVYFNLSNDEFQAYVSTNSISYLNIEIFVIDDNNNSVPVNNLQVANIDEFDIETAAILIENLEEKYQQLFIGVYVNAEACSELRLIPYEVKEMPEVPACGESVDVSISTPDLKDLSTLEQGEIVYIKGFPIQLTDIMPTNNGLSFTGIMPLPFDCGSAQVRFSQVSMNTMNQITQGTVEGITDDMAAYPDFSMYEVFSVGGDICVEKPAVSGVEQEELEELKGLDYGFDPLTGLHENGTTVDDQGFSIDGEYVNADGTTSPFNPQGCNREGYDMDRNVCDPKAGPNPAAEKYVKDNEAQLSSQIDGQLNNLKATTDTAVSTKTTMCEALTGEIRTFLVGKDFEQLVKGENEQFIIKGMHTQFASEPKLIDPEPGNRDAGIVKLEKDHKALYACDKELAELEEKQSIIDEIISSLTATLKQQILEDLSRLSEFAFNEVNKDDQSIENWLLSRIEYYIENDQLIRPEENPEGGLIVENNESNEFEGLSRKERRALEKNKKIQERLQEAFKLAQNSKTLDQNILRRPVNSQEEKAQIKSALADPKTIEINGVDKAFYVEELYYQRFSSKKSNNSFNLLPLQIPSPFGDESMPIYITRFEISASNNLNDLGGNLDAIMLIKDPNSEQGVVFRAENITFGAGGFLGGESKLILDSEVNIRLNNAALLFLNPEQTNVTWDCHGFKSLNLSGGIEFCREFITPLTEDLQVIEGPERYRLNIDIQDISAWNEFYLKVDAPPFAVTKYEDVKWELDSMVLDFSSKVTPPEITALMGYENENYDTSTMIFSPQWKGFFINEISANFPKDIGGDNTGTTTIEADPAADNETEADRPGYVKISGNSIIIDGSGFSGRASVSSTGSPLFQGSLSGWGYSVDGIELFVLNNDFAGTGFIGGIQIPVLEEPMDYEALIYPEQNYSFTISPGEMFTSDLFLADLTIAESSSIKLAKDDEGFLAVANLTGSLTLNTDRVPDAIQIETPALCFQEFKVSNRPSYLEAGKWGFKGGTPGFTADFGGFKASILDIKPYSPMLGQAGLGFKLSLALVDEIKIEAGGEFGILGDLVIDDFDRQKWKFSKIDVQSFFIDAKIKEAATVRGLLKWYDDTTSDDPNWGKGFIGNLEAQFNLTGQSENSFGLAAAGQFGNLNGEKYFYVDALATLPVGIPIGPLELYGFGGGVSYHMSFDDIGITNLNNDDNMVQMPALQDLTAGTTFSGGEYIPNFDIDLGLKAITAFRTVPSNSIFNGALSFGMFFNDGGGINNIFLEGNGQFFADPNLSSFNTEFNPDAQMKPMRESPLTAFLRMEYNFKERTLHGNLRSFLNVNDKLRGIGPGDKLVDGTIHFGPDNWYIWMGVPANSPPPFSGGGPAGFKLDLGVTNIEASAYFDIGTLTPPMPRLPQTVREIAPSVNDNASLRRSGQGFVAGASFGIKAGFDIASVISADLQAAAGFDIMLRKFEDVDCEDSQEEIGINGWYAVGQMWAYLTGQFKFLGATILKAGIAAVLQAQLPNPFFAQAVLGVQFSVLGVDYNKDFGVSFGDPCNLVPIDENDGIALNVISAMTPVDTQEDVSTLTNGKVYFSVPLNREFEFPQSNEVVNFKAILQDVSLITDEGVEIDIRELIATDRLSMDIIPADELPGSTTFTLTTIVDVLKRTGNGTYTSVGFQDKVHVFTTAPAFDIIPEANIANAYPYDGQINFHKGQLTNLFIDLKKEQTDLLRETQDVGNPKLILTSNDGTNQIIEFSYDGLNSKIRYAIDPDLLVGNRVYKLELSKGASSEKTELYSMYFRVSIHATVREKIEALEEDMRPSINAGNYNSYIFSELISYDEIEKGIYEFDALLPIQEENRIIASLNEFSESSLIPFISSYAQLDPNEISININENGRRRIGQEDFASGIVDFSGLQKISFVLETSITRLYANYLKRFQESERENIDVQGQSFTSSADLPTEFISNLVSINTNVRYKIPGSPSSGNTTLKFLRQ